MGNQSDNWVEDIFWLIVKTSWLLIVVCASVFMFVYKAIARQQASQPATVTVGVPVKPKSAHHDLGKKYKKTWLALSVTLGIAFPPLYMFVTHDPHYIVLLLVGTATLLVGGGLSFYIFQRTQTQLTGVADELPSSAPPVLIEPRTPLNSYTIRLPGDTEWNREKALHFIEQITSTFPSVVLRLIADHTTISWQLVDTAHLSPGMVEPILRASYPAAEISISQITSEHVTEPFFRLVCSFKQVNEFVAPLSYVTDIKQGSNHFDPLAGLTQAMNTLHPGERIIVSLGVLEFALDAHKRGEKLITKSTIHPLQLASWEGIQDALVKKAYQVDRVDKYVSEDQHVLTEKLRQKLYHCVLMLQIDTPDVTRAVDLVVQMLSEFTHFSWVPYNALDWYEASLEQCTTYVQNEADANASDSLRQIEHLIQSLGKNESRRTAVQPKQYPLLILEPREMATLWHVPHHELTASRIGWSRGLVSLSDRLRRTPEGIRLGSGLMDGVPVPVLLPDNDRVTHLNIIGRTGVGKSTLMHHLIHQDIARGYGVAVVDPHGNLIRDILRTSIPEARANDVVVIDLADAAYPVPLNPLRSARSYAATARVLGVIERLFEGFENAPRMVNYLRSALLLLQADPEATLRDVSRVFLDDVYREDLLSKVDNPELEDFWDMQYNQSSPQMRAQIADPVLSRVRPFFANPYLYPMLCHPHALDFGTMMKDNKIILISLDVNEETLHGQERDLLGALLVTQIQIAAMRQSRSTPFFVSIDEVQRFVTTSLSEVLSEARKYGVALTTANQYLGQLTGKTLEAVMGNVGTTIVFACSPEDGQALSHYMKPEFTPDKLVNQDRFVAAVKMQVEARTQPAFSLLTEPPLPYPDDWQERETHLRATSREHYTPMSREAVLEGLKSRYPRRPTSRHTEPQSEQDSFYE